MIILAALMLKKMIRINWSLWWQRSTNKNETNCENSSSNTWTCFYSSSVHLFGFRMINLALPVCHTFIMCEYALFSHLRLFRSISNIWVTILIFFIVAIHAVYSFGPNLGVELENPYHIFLIVFHPTFNSTTDLFYEISRLNVTVKDQWTCITILTCN